MRQRCSSCRSAGGSTPVFLHALSLVQLLQSKRHRPLCRSVVTAFCWTFVSIASLQVELPLLNYQYQAHDTICFRFLFFFGWCSSVSRNDVVRRGASVSCLHNRSLGQTICSSSGSSAASNSSEQNRLTAHATSSDHELELGHDSPSEGVFNTPQKDCRQCSLHMCNSLRANLPLHHQSF